VAKHARQTLYADDDPSSRIWAQRNDLRDLLKQPIMTLPYGLTQSGMLDQIKEACKERGIAASSDAMDRFRDHIWNAIEEKLPGAMETRKYIQNIAQYFLDRGTFMRWTTPSGFAVTNRYCESETRRVRLPFAGQVVKIADGYTDEPQKQKTINSAVANFTHSLDAAHLAMSVNKAVESGITNIMTVHDCFGTLAPDVHLFALIRRWELQELALWNPLLVLREANLPANENDLQLPIFDRDFEPGWLVRSEYFDR
jgi:DNA-directed RNA polymerase